MTTIAFTAPGVVVNAGGSYGNFSSDGLAGHFEPFRAEWIRQPGSVSEPEQLGQLEPDPGPGRTGGGDVVQNGYNSQYGRAAGAIINYTTKSGTNKFHGDGGLQLQRHGHECQRMVQRTTTGQSPAVTPYRTSGLRTWAAPSSRTRYSSLPTTRVCATCFPARAGFVTLPLPAIPGCIAGNVPAPPRRGLSCSSRSRRLTRERHS